MHSSVALRIAEGKSMVDKKVSNTMKQLCNEATKKAVTQFAAKTDAKLSSLGATKSLDLEKILAKMVEEAESGSRDRLKLRLETAVDEWETKLKAMVNSKTASIVLPQNV